MAIKLLRALRERGHEFTVVTRQDYWDLPLEAEYQGIRISRLPFWKTLSKRNVDALTETKRQVARIKREFAPELVHIYSFGPSVVFHLTTMAAHSTRSLVTVHEAWPDCALDRDALLGQTLRSADWVTGVSESALSEPARRVPEILSRSSIIYNGADVSRFCPVPLPMNPPHLLCLGRLVREKGFDLALKALHLLKDRFPTVRMFFAGDGPARTELEVLAGALKLTDRVAFVGWIAPEKVPEVINSATVMILPSWTEGMPLVALEAALMARPLVATRVGGLPEVVLHQRTGLLVEKNDWRALAKAIESLLDPPERASQMGEAARKHAVKLFGWDRCVDGYDTLYRQVAKMCPDQMT